MRRRRGIVLIVVLAIIAVLGLLAGTFAFRMNAELAGVKASADLQQARLAARSGIDRMIFLLRSDRTNVDAWYNNAAYFRRVPVWVKGDDRLSASEWDKDPVPGRPAWRYSIVAIRRTGPDTKDVKIRYGLTDESSKINIANLANKALRAQVLSLLDQMKDQISRDNFVAEELADSLIDWQDADDNLNSINGAESSYYYQRSPRYRAKNRPLQSLDELLMVRGFDGLVLYGEDANRNGYLDVNEDDGGNEIDTFPPDNGDGELYRGLLPYITVYSWDWNTSNDNKAKIPLNQVSMQMLEQPRFQYLADEIRPEIIQFIEDARRQGYTFRSVGELLGLEIYQGGKSNYTKAWSDYDALVDELNNDRKEMDEEQQENQNQNPDDQGGNDNQNPDNQGGDNGGMDNGDNGNSDQNKNSRAQQSARPDDPQNQTGAGNRNNGRSGANNNSGRDRSPRTGNRDGSSGPPRSWSQQQRDFRDRRSNRGPMAPSSAPGGDEPLGDPVAISPVTAQDMTAICDRFTVETAPVIPGLINVNTASEVVLRTIPGLTEEQVANIVAQRQQLSGEDKTSIGWLVANGAVDPETFALISNMLTTRSLQYHADVIGFADHTKAFKRFEVVVEMRFQLAQIVYFRDISSLGAGYPVWDDEQTEGLSYDDGGSINTMR